MSAERMLDLLRRRLEEEGQPAGGPVSIAELHRRLLPYHICRSEIGFATKAEYDVAMLRFLVEGGVRLQEKEFQEALRRELASPEPGLAVLQRYAASEIRLSSDAAGAERSVATRTAAGAREAGAANGDAATRAAAPARDAAAPAAAPVRPREAPERTPEAASRPAGGAARPVRPGPDAAGGIPAGGEDTPGVPVGPGRAAGSARTGGAATAGAGAGPACWRCGGALPARPGMRFCPDCGRDQRLRECVACGAEVEAAWAYCAMCGARQAAPG